MKKTSSGSDGIPVSVFRFLPSPIWSCIAGFFLALLSTCVCPQEWSQVLVTLIPKTAFASKPDCYRPIGVTSAMERLFDRFLLRHLASLPHVWHTHQFGRKGKQAMEAMAFIRVALHHAYSHSVPCVVVKLDISKAFDNVDHVALLRMLQQRGLPNWLVRAYMGLLRNRFLVFRTPVGITRPMPLLRGLLQGKPSSPLLFCLLLDWALKDFVPLWSGLGLFSMGVICTHVLYMDDILLFASSVQNAERMVADVATALHSCGLQLNVSKTVWAASATIPEQTANFGGQAVERSESIKFLGSVYCPANPSDEDVQPRISASWRVFHKWKPMLTRKTLDLNLRLRLLRAT
eukprot:6475447-Amphidinium_carterae.2